MVEEKKLLMQLKKRQTSAIEQTIEIYTPYLGTVLYNMAGDSLKKEDAEEIISDAFVKLWENAEYIDLNKGTMRSYLAMIAKNFALKRLNKKTEYQSLDEMEIVDKSSFEDEKTEKDFLWQAVMTLGEPDNEIFVRYYKYGEKLKDISKATGINLSTVKTKLSRGKQRLKTILENAEEL